MTSPYRDTRMPLYRCIEHRRYERDCEPCREARRAWDRKRDRLVGYGLGSSLVDAAPAQRRLQALMAIGWPLKWLGEQAGLSQQAISQLLWERLKVSRPMDRKIRDLYERLWNVKPVGTNPAERMSISRTINRAKALGYEVPLAWDDDEIDRPLTVQPDELDYLEGRAA